VTQKPTQDRPNVLIEVEAPHEAPREVPSITVAAGIPGKLKPYSLPAGSTIRNVLNRAELNPEGQSVHVDGEVVTDLDTPLQDNQTVMLFRPVKGNEA
jgi:sulfur carrier protein ThiS